MKRLLLMTALALGPACARHVPLVGEPGASDPNGQDDDAYRAVLDRYTDHAELYRGFDTSLYAAITNQTLRFREARVARRASFQALPEANVQALLTDEKAQAAAGHDFTFGVHANDPGSNDFDRKWSMWRLTLITPSGTAVPSEIHRVGRANLDMRAYYPYLGEFWVAYRVRFPKQFPDGTPVIPPGTKQVTFRVASTLGQTQMTVAAE